MLVRHATCALTDELLFGRRVDAPLDARGVRQAQATARALAAHAPSAVLSSPRRRAQQTAQAIAAACGHRVHVDARLDELDFGRWSGRPFAALDDDPDWRRWNAARAAHCTPAGDSMAQALVRLNAVLANVAEMCPHATVVLVTHAEVIRAAVLAARGLSFDAFLGVDIAPASITELRSDARGVALERVNEIPADLERLPA